MKKTETEKDVARLRSEIAKLSGRRPKSGDPRYLRATLANLVARKEAGEDVRRPRASELAVSRSISMTPSATRAFDEMLDKEKMSASELVRVALAAYAKSRGHMALAEAMRG